MSKFDLAQLESTIDAAFDDRDAIGTGTRGEVRDAVEEALNRLDRGEVRVAEKAADGNWKVNQGLKKAVLLSFRLNPIHPADLAVARRGPDPALRAAAARLGRGRTPHRRAQLARAARCARSRAAGGGRAVHARRAEQADA